MGGSGRGPRSSGYLVVIAFSLFAFFSVAGRLPLPASAPASAPGLGCLVVRLVGPSVRVGRNARARPCGGGGGGDGAWRAALCLSRASGSLLARVPFGCFLIFRGRCEPRTPGVGPVGLPVGGWGFCVEIAL